VEFDAIVLAGGRAVRLEGADKGAVDVAGRNLLDRALDALADARRIVVVGDERATARAVTWAREQPAYGGPVAATYAGRDALVDAGAGSPTVVVLAVDMPAVTAGTVARLLAGQHEDGAVLAEGGQHHLAMAVRATALDRVRPAQTTGARMRDLWAALDLRDVRADGVEAVDVDTQADLAKVLEGLPRTSKIGPVNLHDWIDELCDALDIDAEVDETLVLDLAKVVADNVERPAAPISAYLVGYAAGLQEADPEGVERLAAKAQSLAEEWDRPADSPDPDDVDDDVPDDSAVDHSDDEFDD
jgi:molybdopterin-guanine dinucleotide biosynthesis protein A